MNIYCPRCLKRYSMPGGQTNILRVRCRGCGAEFLLKPTSAQSHEVKGNKIAETIIVADIQRSFRNQLIELLQRQGFNLLVVEDGIKALEAIKAEPYGMLLVNSYLPGLMGFELIEKVREEVENHPVIILLGAIHNRKRYRRRPETLYGADDYLDEGAREIAILRKLEYHLETPLTTSDNGSREDMESYRLARSVFADMLVYSSEKLSNVSTVNDFYQVFSQEIAEAERFLEDGIPGAASALRNVVEQYIKRR